MNRFDTKGDNRSDNKTFNSTNFQLKYNNPDGDSNQEFRYSRYRDPDISDINGRSPSDGNGNKGSCCYGSEIWKQVKLMTWKNYLLFRRNLKPTIFCILTPVAICLVLVILQPIVNIYTEDLSNKNPDLIYLDKLDRCVNPKGCTTIGYGIAVNKLF